MGVAEIVPHFQHVIQNFFHQLLLSLPHSRQNILLLMTFPTQSPKGHKIHFFLPLFLTSSPSFPYRPSPSPSKFTF